MAARAEDARVEEDLALRSAIGVGRYPLSHFYELAYGVGPSGYGPRLTATSLRIRENNGYLVKIVLLATAMATGTRTTYDAGKGETAESVGRQNRDFQRAMTSGGEFTMITDLKLYSDKLGGKQTGFELREYFYLAHFAIPLQPELELGIKGGNVWGSTLHAPSDKTYDYSAGTFGLAAVVRLQMPVASLEVFARIEPSFFGHTEAAVGAILSPRESFFVSGEAQVAQGGVSLFAAAGVRL